MSPRRPEPRAIMVCPHCNEEQVLYVYPQLVMHKCPKKNNRWVNFVPAEQAEE